MSIQTSSITPTEYLTSTSVIKAVTNTVEPPTISPIFTFTPTLENTTTPSPEPGGAKMTVILQANVIKGKAPLMVNFDARTSYVQFTNGNMTTCGTSHFCSYTFSIYRDSKLIDKINNNNGVLSYICGSKGQYFVTAYICRGDACEDDGVTIDVK